jgi:soluble lytic murein transglycosylase-like protein
VTTSSAAPKLAAADWRGLIASVLAARWPDLVDGPEWIEAQVHTESGGNPNARSPVGAAGLLQLMPGTAKDLGLAPHEVLDPAKNLDAGVRYLHQQYVRFPEIPDHLDRLFWSFAAYNGGRGYCNKALAIAREDGQARWHTWELARHYLGDPRCLVSGRSPDEHQMWNYVARIQRKATKLMQEE